jgi:hypothetical protein
MSLSDIAAIRLLTSDQPVLRQQQWQANGETAELRLEVGDILADPAPRVWEDNDLLTEGTDYTIDYTYGRLIFPTVPDADTLYTVEFVAVVYTDAEVQHFLDRAIGDTTLAAVGILWAWAASAAKRAKKETLSGGGAAGLVTVDTGVTARELRESAKALFQHWQTTEGSGALAESMTEVAWTPQQAERMIVARLLRDM